MINPDGNLTSTYLSSSGIAPSQYQHEKHSLLLTRQSMQRTSMPFAPIHRYSSPTAHARPTACSLPCGMPHAFMPGHFRSRALSRRAIPLMSNSRIQMPLGASGMRCPPRPANAPLSALPISPVHPTRHPEPASAVTHDLRNPRNRHPRRSADQSP